ncbi:glycosyltransferase family 9 protein [Gallibacterium salpingitidis]|uniref:Glycosyl transferase n=1 Tax=Gallibacterium salpingitidis TaxID=505341 RepID=A0A1A7P2Z4_9PAST|nr:glycosyltransferase family 9 protein [Gallibacterium salpingitidis]OBW96101.1 glycosyl transferase [Gallibacterium salpingitidis]
MSLFSQPPQSLCILRLSAIGDVCNALAAVQQIQAYYPSTKIVWVIGKVEAQLLKDVPGIEFVIFDKKQGWRGVLALWKKLRPYKFDALLDMQVAIRASILSLGISAKYRIGFNRQRAKEGQWLFTNRKVGQAKGYHVLDGFLSFAEYIGVPIQQPSWRFPISNVDREYVRTFIDTNRQTIAISPCSSKKEKDWLVERYAEIACLAAEKNIQVIITGSPSKHEMQVAEQICQLCPLPLTNLAGKTSLQQLVALFAEVDLVITPDSGPAHMATMAGTRVLGLYACHNPRRTGPYYDVDNVVSVYDENAAQQYRKSWQELAWGTKVYGKDLMAQITTEQVATKMWQLLALK